MQLPTLCIAHCPPSRLLVHRVSVTCSIGVGWRVGQVLRRRLSWLLLLASLSAHSQRAREVHHRTGYGDAGSASHAAKRQRREWVERGAVGQLDAVSRTDRSALLDPFAERTAHTSSCCDVIRECASLAEMADCRVQVESAWIQRCGLPVESTQLLQPEEQRASTRCDCTDHALEREHNE